MGLKRSRGRGGGKVERIAWSLPHPFGTTYSFAPIIFLWLLQNGGLSLSRLRHLFLASANPKKRLLSRRQSFREVRVFERSEISSSEFLDCPGLACHIGRSLFRCPLFHIIFTFILTFPIPVPVTGSYFERGKDCTKPSVPSLNGRGQINFLEPLIESYLRRSRKSASEPSPYNSLCFSFDARYFDDCGYVHCMERRSVGIKTNPCLHFIC